MKNVFLFIFLIIAIQTSAQSYVLDQEKYLKPDEVARVDSMLSAFHKRTGTVLLMSTDSLDINSSDYNNKIFQRYFPDTTSSNRVLMLLMSRKTQFVKIVASKSLLPFIDQVQMLDMINAGAPSLRAKKGEEGVTLILKKAMETIDKLPR